MEFSVLLPGVAKSVRADANVSTCVWPACSLATCDVLPHPQDFTLGKAALFKEAVAADLVQTVPSLGSFTPRNVLIMELRGGSDDDLAVQRPAHGAGAVLRRQLSSSGVAVVANLQVQPAAVRATRWQPASSAQHVCSWLYLPIAWGCQKTDVQKAVSGTNVGGTPGSFASDLGASLAQRGVVSKANANHVAVAPGNTTPGAGGGLTGAEIAGTYSGGG